MALLGQIPCLAMQIKDSKGELITFRKCERCIRQDTETFPVVSPDSASTSFALIGANVISFKDGVAEIPICFRCVPTHVSRGENYIAIQFGIQFGRMGLALSDFVPIQWKVFKSSF